MTSIGRHDFHSGQRSAAAMSCEGQMHPLPNHYAVLGRYNGKKTRPLTPATRIYRKFRKGIRRTKNLSETEIQYIKDETSRLLREDRKQPHLPEVVFCVDIHKLEQGQSEQPTVQNKLLSCLDYDGQEVILVQDIHNIFLRSDVDSKRRHNPNPQIEKRTNPVVKKRSPTKSVSTASNCSTLTTAASTISGSASSKKSASTSARFCLYPGSQLESELEKVCVKWTGEGPEMEAIKRKTSLIETYKDYFNYYQTVFQLNNAFEDSSVTELQILNETILVHVANHLGNSMIEWYEKYPSTWLKGEPNAWCLRGDVVNPVVVGFQRHFPGADMDSAESSGGRPTDAPLANGPRERHTDVVSLQDRRIQDSVFTHIGSNYHPKIPMDGSIGTHDDNSWGFSPSGSEEDENVMNAAYSLCECSIGSDRDPKKYGSRIGNKKTTGEHSMKCCPNGIGSRQAVDNTAQLPTKDEEQDTTDASGHDRMSVTDQLELMPPTSPLKEELMMDYYVAKTIEDIETESYFLDWDDDLTPPQHSGIRERRLSGGQKWTKSLKLRSRTRRYRRLDSKNKYP